MNIYIVYKISLWSYTVGQDLTLEKVLSGATKLTANSDPDKYKYSGYGIEAMALDVITLVVFRSLTVVGLIKTLK